MNVLLSTSLTLPNSIAPRYFACMKKEPFTDTDTIAAVKINHLVNAIQNKKHLLTSKKVTAGFDGFIDAIIKIIKKKQPQKTSLFTTIKEFGNYILEKEGTSFSLELEEQNKKLGGNMPIMANALGQMGITVNCIGALGYPQADPIFKNLSSNCQLFSFTDPGISTAYEFKDGKIIKHTDKFDFYRWSRQALGLMGWVLG